MISDYQTNTIYLSDLLRTNKNYSKTYNHLFQVLSENGIQYDFLEKTKDIWARDYMPIQVSKDRFVEFRYDPDYLQGTGKVRRGIKTYPDIVCDYMGIMTVKTDIILDGGNVVKSDKTVILTDKVVKENRRTYDRKDLIQQFEILFETDRIILIPYDIDEYGHSDGMVRFLDPDTVLINWIYRTGDDDLRKRLLKPITEKGLKYEWLDIGLSGKEIDNDNWAYINFLQTKDLILVPKLDTEVDDKAYNQIFNYFKCYANSGRILQVDSKQIVKKDGALNCISWTIMK